jgi:hypothetical protein
VLRGFEATVFYRDVEIGKSDLLSYEEGTCSDVTFKSLE